MHPSQSWSPVQVNINMDGLFCSPWDVKIIIFAQTALAIRNWEGSVIGSDESEPSWFFYLARIFKLVFYLDSKIQTENLKVFRFLSQMTKVLDWKLRFHEKNRE